MNKYVHSSKTKYIGMDLEGKRKRVSMKEGKEEKERRKMQESVIRR